MLILHETRRSLPIAYDYTMEYKVRMDTVKIRDFYSRIENQIENEQRNYDRDSVTSWSITTAGNYHYTQPWSDSQETLQIEINKKQSVMKVQYGCW